MKRIPVRPEDIALIASVSDPRPSPRGCVAFTVIRADLDGDRYVSRIWLLEEGGELRSLTSGPSDKLPEWSPDGRELAFTSRRTLKEEEPGGELWIAPVDGGEPRMVVKLRGGVEKPRWSPDGRYIAFTSAVGEPEEDVKVIRRLPFWYNGRGYVYWCRRHLFLADPRSGACEQLTRGDFEVLHASWSPSGEKIAAVVREDDLKPYVTDIAIIDVSSGELEKLTRGDMYIVDVEWSPDGKWLAFRGHRFPRGFVSSHAKVWVMPASGGEPECLTADLDAANAVNSDVRGPSSSRHLQWGPDGYVYFPVARGGCVHLYRARPGGPAEEVIGGSIVVEDYALFGGAIAYVAMTSTSPPELYLWKNGQSEKLTGFNDAFLSRRALAKPERFTFRASDGAEIEGWVLRPVNLKPGEKRPAVLEIHGGPPTAYGESFMHEFHVLSGAGYAVIYVNPRGSTGYSEEFRDIRGAYGSRDYADLMEAVEEAVQRFDFIDPSRLGVAGGSYGGFMVNWIVGHTDRFKAAVSMRSICNWVSMYGTTDIGYYFVPDQLGADPWTGIEKLWDQSPLKYAPRVKTPLLLIHSDQDYRCWLDQALQMFTALKARGCEVELAVFPRENHDLSRTGKPKHRVKRLKLILDWFNRHLGGTDISGEGD